MVSFLLWTPFRRKYSCRFSITETKNKRKTKTKNHRKTKRRNWLELPRDIMILIFSKLDTTDILYRAQFVCSSWLQITKEPSLFRNISIPDVPLNYPVDKVATIVEEALDRSCGELVKIFIGGYGCYDELLHSIVQKSNSLKSLRLSISDVTENGLVEALKRLPLLEELELKNCDRFCVLEVIKELGISCSQLKRMGVYFRWDTPSKIECEQVELAIVENLPNFKSLCLTRVWVTNKAFEAILDQCSPLDHLEFCHCYSNDIKEDLKEKSVGKFIDARFPCMLSKTFVDPTSHPLWAGLRVSAGFASMEPYRISTCLSTAPRVPDVQGYLACF